MLSGAMSMATASLQKRSTKSRDSSPSVWLRLGFGLGFGAGLGWQLAPHLQQEQRYMGHGVA